MSDVVSPAAPGVADDRATPRPWMFTGDIETLWRTVATDPYRDIGPFNEQWRRDAELIVKAVNSYDALRTALTRTSYLYHYRGDPIDHRPAGGGKHKPEDGRDCGSPVCVQARAALTSSQPTPAEPEKEKE